MTKTKKALVSLAISAVFVLTAPVVNNVCWEGCTLVYNNSIYVFLASGMAFFSVIFSVFINFLLTFSLVLIFLNVIEKRTFGRFRKIIAVVLFLIFISASHLAFFLFSTEDGEDLIDAKRKQSAFIERMNTVEEEMKDLQTKQSVESYIEAQENFTNVICENTKVSNIRDVVVFDANINFEEEYHESKLYIGSGFKKISEIISEEIFKPQYNPRNKLGKQEIVKEIVGAFEGDGRPDAIESKARVKKFLESYDFTNVNSQSQKEAHAMVGELIDEIAKIVKEEQVRFYLRFKGLENKSYYCDIEKKLTATFLGSYQPDKSLIDEYHDCILYVNKELKTLICFKDEITKYIFINSGRNFQHDQYKIFYDSFDREGITIDKYTPEIDFLF